MKNQNYTLSNLFPSLDAFFYDEDMIKAFEDEKCQSQYFFLPGFGVNHYNKDCIYIMDYIKYKFMVIVLHKNSNNYEYIIYDYEVEKYYSLDKFLKSKKVTYFRYKEKIQEEIVIKILSHVINFYDEKLCFSIRDSAYNKNILDEYFYIIENYIKKTMNYNEKQTYEIDLLKKYLNNDEYLEMIKEFKNVNQYNGTNTLLICSMICNSKNVFDLLIKNGCDVNLCSLNNGTSPLQFAVGLKNKYYISKLIEKGANVNSQDMFGKNVLYDAIQTNDDEIFDIIYSLNGLEVKMNEFPTETRLGNILAQNEDNPIQEACCMGNFYALKKLAETYDINTFDGYHPLYYALKYFNTSDVKNPDDYYKIIEFLLEKGADINWEYVYNIPHSSGKDRIIHNKKIIKILEKIDDIKINELVLKYTHKKNQNFIKESIPLFCKLGYNDYIDDFELFKFILIILFSETEIEEFGEYISLKFFCKNQIVCHFINKKDYVFVLYDLFDEIKLCLNDNNIISFIEESIIVWTEMFMYKTRNYEKIGLRIIWLKGFANVALSNPNKYIDFYNKCIKYIELIEKQFKTNNILDNNL